MKLKKSKIKETIETGIGQFTTKENRAVMLFEAMGLIERHCIYPELYQDIKNKIEAIVTKSSKNRMMVAMRARQHFISIQFKMVRSHLVMILDIHGHLRYDTSWLDSNYRADTIYLRITNDGLIADILEYKDLPNYNPHNVAIVLDRDEKTYH